MKHILSFFLLGFLFLINSCSLTDLEDNLENPNNVNVSNTDVNTLTNQILLEFGDFVSEAGIPSSELSRQMAMIGGDAYPRAYQAQDFNAIWNRAYQDVLNQTKTLLEATDGTGRTVHSGVGRIVQAYTLLTLVDLFGDVPYSEALRGDEFIFNPSVDDDQELYNVAIGLLDEAINLLSTAPTAGITRDIYYGGDRVKWSALARTLKLKAYMNLRLTNSALAKAEINKLLAEDLIDTDAEEFTYKYGTADIPSRSRHPLYIQMYQPVAGNASGYIGNYFLLASYNQKGVEDPRWRFYFFRQVGSIDAALNDEPESIPCITSPRPSHYGPGQAWCAFDPGFFGREHGNNDGIPPDGPSLTCVGVYPCGGASDKNTDPAFLGPTRTGQGANGAGIEPIWMASFTEFLKAEAALMLDNDAAAAKTAMVSGINKSISRVTAFAASKAQSLPAGLQAPTAPYISTVEALYDAAATTDAKLDVIMKEYYIALWGNGIEAYNLYRRTGKPLDIQPMRAAAPGNFIRSFLYPADFVNLNNTVTQKSNTAVTKVFWDNNPDDFIK